MKQVISMVAIVLSLLSAGGFAFAQGGTNSPSGSQGGTGSGAGSGSAGSGAGSGSSGSGGR
jgi:hypothetical protein